MMKRRGFLLGLLAMPLIVRASSLDYVPRGLVLRLPSLSDDRIRNAWLDAMDIKAARLIDANTGAVVATLAYDPRRLDGAAGAG